MSASTVFASGGEFAGNGVVTEENIKNLTYTNSVEYIDQKTEMIFEFVESRKRRFSKRKPHISIELSNTKKTSLFKKLYKRGVLDHSVLPGHVYDKLMAYQILKRYIGNKTDFWYPKSMGLKYFLQKNKLLDEDKNLYSGKENVLAALKREFPNGFIVKPATSVNSFGMTKGFYFKMPEFVADLMDHEHTKVYTADEFNTPTKSDRMAYVTSGEKLILQENVVLAAGVNMEVKPKGFAEVRVHSMEDRTIEGITYSRWKDNERDVSEVQLIGARLFIQKFLDELPESLLAGQAWSYDVAALDNGAFRIIEINTNHGTTQSWSSYLARPHVLAKFFRYLEDNYPISFPGYRGILFRNGFGNLFKYMRKKYIQQTI